MRLDEALARVAARYDELEHLLAQPEVAASGDLGALSKEYAELKPIVDAHAELQQARADLAELESWAETGDSDERALAHDELPAQRQRVADLEDRIRRLLLPKDAADEKNAILEIRAGTGGDEAALFAADLLRMYQRYAELQGWRFEPLELDETPLGGLKDATIRVTGAGAYARLKYESGTHRVQRVPQTETGGRIHTSAATVAVLPEAEDVDIQIDPNDLRVDTFRASGAGGQHVNRTESAVRLTHLPTGLQVAQQSEKSQHRNREKAMMILRSRLYEQERARKDAEREADRRAQVGSGDRSERIRTYNFPQGRVTDHRINKTTYRLQEVLTGTALDSFIDALIAEDQAQRLAEAGA